MISLPISAVCIQDSAFSDAFCLAVAACTVEERMPLGAPCPAELGNCMMDAECSAAAETADDPTTETDEAALACDASETCSLYRGCEMRAATAGVNVTAACQSPADDCFTDEACVRAVSTEDDPATLDDESMLACNGNSLCSAFLECELQSEIPNDLSCGQEEGECFGDPDCLVAVSTEDDPATPVDEFAVACSLNSLCAALMDCQFAIEMPTIIAEVSTMCPVVWAECEASITCALEFEQAIRLEAGPPADGSTELMNLVLCLMSSDQGSGNVCDDCHNSCDPAGNEDLCHADCNAGQCGPPDCIAAQLAPFMQGGDMEGMTAYICAQLDTSTCDDDALAIIAAEVGDMCGGDGGGGGGPPDCIAEQLAPFMELGDVEGMTAYICSEPSQLDTSTCDEAALADIAGEVGSMCGGGDDVFCMDTTGDGLVATEDLLILLALFDGTCERVGDGARCP